MMIADWRRSHFLWPAVIFIAAVVVRLALLATLGVHIGADTTFYSSKAAIIVAAHYNIFALAVHGVPPYYWLYPLVMAVFRSNATAIIVFQILLQGLAAILVYAIGATLFDRRAGIMAGLLYVGLFELFQWDIYILTDSLFVFLLVLATYLLVRWERLRTRSTAIGLVITLVGIALLRPTSLPFFVAVGLWGLRTFRASRRFIVASLIVGAGVALLVATRLGLFNPHQGYGIAYYGGYFFMLFQHGIVIRDRPAYTLDVHWDHGVTLSNLAFLGSIFLHRLVAFWYATVREFAPFHKLLNIVTLVPLYVLAVIGVWRRPNNASVGSRITFVLQVILFFWVFQALTEVDYDFRYRAPVLPFVVLLAGNGLASILPQTIIQSETVAELGRYIAAGSVVALTDFGLLNLFVRVFHANLYVAILVGFVIGSVVGYVIHSRWTFRYDARGQHITKLSQLMTVGIGGIVLTESVIYGIVTVFHANYNLAKLLAVGISFVWAYSCSRWWVFRKS